MLSGRVSGGHERTKHRKTVVCCWSRGLIPKTSVKGRETWTHVRGERHKSPHSHACFPSSVRHHCCFASQRDSEARMRFSSSLTSFITRWQSDQEDRSERKRERHEGARASPAGWQHARPHEGWCWRSSDHQFIRSDRIGGWKGEALKPKGGAGRQEREGKGWGSEGSWSRKQAREEEERSRNEGSRRRR